VQDFQAAQVDHDCPMRREQGAVVQRRTARDWTFAPESGRLLPREGKTCVEATGS
jgi:hypothetical protein